MPRPIRYRCRCDLLTAVEAALVAHGFTRDVPFPVRGPGHTNLVMTYGLSTVLLSSRSNSETADIEVWGVAQAMATHLLESLPIKIEKQPLTAGN